MVFANRIRSLIPTRTIRDLRGILCACFDIARRKVGWIYRRHGRSARKRATLPSRLASLCGRGRAESSVAAYAGVRRRSQAATDVTSDCGSMSIRRCSALGSWHTRPVGESAGTRAAVTLACSARARPLPASLK